MLDKLFVGKDAKALKRALALTAKKAEIEKELSGLRAQFADKLTHSPDGRFELEEGMAVLQETNKVLLNTDMITEMLKADPKLLEAFTREMVTIKQSSLEKYIGSPVYSKLVKGVVPSKTVRFIVK